MANNRKRFGSLFLKGIVLSILQLVFFAAIFFVMGMFNLDPAESPLGMIIGFLALAVANGYAAEQVTKRIK